MRLTLRTLLAYLDDTLDPAEVKRIGQKIAESETAQELIARIREVTRKRSLTTPPLTGPNAPKWDANMAAEYLDNELTGEDLAELERICLESDVHLAEIAASHQILTLVEGEPALVPPTAKERMYGLVKGRESVPSRRAVAARASSSGDAGDDEAILGLPSFGGQGSWIKWAVPLLGLVLFIGLAASLFFTLPRPTAPGGGSAQANNTKDADKDKEKSKDIEAKKDDSKDGVKADSAGKEIAKAGDSKKDETKTPEPNKDEAKKDELKKDEPKKEEPKKDEAKKDEPKKDGTDKKTEVEKVLPPPSKPTLDITRLATYRGSINSNTPSILAQRRKDIYERVAQSGPINSGEPLVCMPGFVSEVRTESGMGLVLRGNTPELSPEQIPQMDYLLESSVVLHTNPDFDLDITLKQGRIYIANRKLSGPAYVRLRFRDEIWDLTLQTPDTEVCVELFSLYLRGINFEDGEEPLVQVYVWLLEGQAGLRVDTFHYSDMKAPMSVNWDNKKGQIQGPTALREKVPFIWDKQLPAVTRPPGWIEELKKMSEKLVGGPVTVGLKSIVENDASPEAQRILAIYCLSAVDDIRKLFDILGNENPRRGLDRDRAIFTLRRWIGRTAESGHLIYDPKTKTGFLKDKYSPSECKKILVLLHDFSDSQRREKETFDMLVDCLKSDKIAIRELGYWHLQRFAGPEAPKTFDPAAPAEIRAKGFDDWKKMVDSGKLPAGPRSGPMGK